MPITTINGAALHYLQAGSGPDMVMVHGGAANLAFWYMRVLPLLADRFRVTVFDLRGHGLSEITPDGYTTRNLASDLGGLLDHLGLERVHLVGHSLGGAISLHFAALHPERITTLALVDARIHALQPWRDPDDAAYWAKRKGELIAKGLPLTDDSPRVVYALLDELSDAPRDALMSTSPWNGKSRAAKNWKRLVTNTTFAADLRVDSGLSAELIESCASPTLLSYGGNSHCLPSCRVLERLLRDHKTVIHEGVGHFFPLLSPALAANDLRQFIEPGSDLAGEPATDPGREMGANR